MSGIVNRGLVQRGLSAHAAIGLLASALLYLVCLTGGLSVFAEEWQRAEQPDAPEMTRIAPEAVQAAVVRVLASEKGKPQTEHLFVHLPVEALPRTTVTTDNQAVHVDANGAVAMPEHDAWTEFLLELHYTLTLPSLIGLTVVGILGVMLIAVSLTGILAHPRIFRDAFRLRARDRGGVGLADWHNRLGVWTLPFGLAVALTGAAIGLATINGQGLATAFHGGDIEAAYAPIFGEEGQPDARPAGVPDVAASLHTMARRFPGVTPTYVIVHDPLTAGQHIQVIADHPRRLIFGEYYGFDTEGRFLGTTGLADGAVGQQAVASGYKLHFGNFGGLAVKLAYAVLGLALCVVVATGTSIWLGKRERRGFRHPRLRAGWDGVVWGIPVALAVTFLVRLAAGNAAPLTPVFWAAAALIVAACTAAGTAMPVRRAMQAALVLGIVAIGIVVALNPWGVCPLEFRHELG